MTETPAIRAALATMRTQEIVRVARLCRAKPDAVSLCFGESDLATPEVVQGAAMRAMAEGHTTYADRRGIAPLRDAIQEYHDFTHGVALDRERISATSSGMTSIMVALQCLVEAGDNVVVVCPIWPNVVIAVESMGATVKFVSLELHEDTWTLDLDKVKSACDDRTRAVFVATPSNPTGWLMGSDEQRELLEFARRRGLWIIADEVYNRIVYDESVASPSFLEIAEDNDPLFVIQSFSKTWSMTGWRLGWMVHPVGVGQQVGNLSAINSTGSATFIQHGGVAAIRQGEPFVATMRDRCASGRQMVIDAFAPYQCVTVPEMPASFYAFFHIAGVANSLEFAEQLVEQAGVGIAPGSAFGPGFEGYFRICFAQDQERLMVALERLQDVVAER